MNGNNRRLSDHHVDRLLERVSKARTIERTPYGATLDVSAEEPLKFSINKAGTEFTVSFRCVEIGTVDAGLIAMAIDDRQVELERERQAHELTRVQNALDSL